MMKLYCSNIFYPSYENTCCLKHLLQMETLSLIQKQSQKFSNLFHKTLSCYYQMNLIHQSFENIDLQLCAEILKCLNRQLLFFYFSKEFKKAKDLFSISLLIFPFLKDKEHLLAIRASIYINISCIYQDLLKYDKAISLIQTALDDTENQIDKFIIKNNIARIHHLDGKGSLSMNIMKEIMNELLIIVDEVESIQNIRQKETLMFIFFNAHVYGKVDSFENGLSISQRLLGENHVISLKFLAKVNSTYTFSPNLIIKGSQDDDFSSISDKDDKKDNISRFFCEGNAEIRQLKDKIDHMLNIVEFIYNNKTQIEPHENNHQILTSFMNYIKSSVNDIQSKNHPNKKSKSHNEIYIENLVDEFEKEIKSEENEKIQSPQLVQKKYESPTLGKKKLGDSLSEKPIINNNMKGRTFSKIYANNNITVNVVKKTKSSDEAEHDDNLPNSKFESQEIHLSQVDSPQKIDEKISFDGAKAKSNKYTIMISPERKSKDDLPYVESMLSEDKLFEPHHKNIILLQKLDSKKDFNKLPTRQQSYKIKLDQVEEINIDGTQNFYQKDSSSKTDEIKYNSFGYSQVKYNKEKKCEICKEPDKVPLIGILETIRNEATINNNKSLAFYLNSLITNYGNKYQSFEILRNFHGKIYKIELKKDLEKITLHAMCQEIDTNNVILSKSMKLDKLEKNIKRFNHEMTIPNYYAYSKFRTLDEYIKEIMIYHTFIQISPNQLLALAPQTIGHFYTSLKSTFLSSNGVVFDIFVYEDCRAKLNVYPKER